MLWKLKGMRGFGTVSKQALADYVRLNATDGGKVTEPFEVILAGFLGTKENADGDAFPWVFSTYDCDRFDERVDPAGWELERYRENPVVLWAHCHSIPAIGTALDIASADCLSGRIRFNAKEYDEFGWSIGERVKAGVIRAGSVGMLVKEIEWVDHKKNPEETSDLIIRKQELLEFSICNVPANPFALQKDSHELSSRGVSGGAENSTANHRLDSIQSGTGAPTARSPGSGHWPLVVHE